MATIANSVNANTSGIQSLTSGGGWNGRTITGTANQISITNGDGTGGNPTIALTSTIYISGVSWDSGSHSITSFTSGTWTPGITLVTPGNSSFTISTIASYFQLGSQVALTLTITISAFTIGTGSGNVIINNFPFTSANVSNQWYEFPVLIADITFGASVLYYTMEMQNNSTIAQLAGTKSAAATYYTQAGDLTATPTIIATGWYSLS